jgi:hypothetical protein
MQDEKTEIKIKIRRRGSEEKRKMEQELKIIIF